LGRRVTRTEFDGTITVIADRYQGKRLNSPNDVVVKSDGSIWFTDPAYGIDWDYEGERAESEIGACHVYRVDPASGAIDRVADDFVRPNGLAFSPDESKLYIADTGATHVEDGPRHIRMFDVIDGKRLQGGAVFAHCSAGFFDGFRFDEDGRLWASAFDGVHCYNQAAELIGKIHVPEIVGNVCFGGLKRNRLYICGTTSLYAYYLLLRGAGQTETYDAEHLRQRCHEFFALRCAKPRFEGLEYIVLGRALHGINEGNAETAFVGFIERVKALELIVR
jgi:gluconolactonase